MQCRCWFGFFEKSLEEAAVVLKELYLESHAMGSNHTLGTYCVNLDKLVNPSEP